PVRPPTVRPPTVRPPTVRPPTVRPPTVRPPTVRRARNEYSFRAGDGRRLPGDGPCVRTEIHDLDRAAARPCLPVARIQDTRHPSRLRSRRRGNRAGEQYRRRARGPVPVLCRRYATLARMNSDSPARAGLWPITWDDVVAARARIAPFLSATPLRRYAELDAEVGARVLVKHDNHLPTNAFKARNGLSLLTAPDEAERRPGVIA